MIQAPDGIGPRHRGLYRFLYKRLRLPRRMVHDVMGWLRRRGRSAEFIRRRQLADRLGPVAPELDPVRDRKSVV